jgi:hypothetical protein
MTTAYAGSGLRGNRKLSLILMLGAICSASVSQLLNAQSEWVVRDTYEPTAPRILYTAARSLGMLRGGVENDIWKTLRYEGSATLYNVAEDSGSQPAATEVDRYYVEMSYEDMGMRSDYDSIGGERVVWVVADDYSWFEEGVPAEGPPVGNTQRSAPEFLEWHRAILEISPAAVIRYAKQHEEQVQVAELEHRVYELNVPYKNGQMNIRLNRNRRPVLVEMPAVHPNFGPVTLTAEYSGYQDYEPIDLELSDEPFSDFYFPSHIVYKLDGKTLLEAEVETCWCTNPYVIFPIPENLISASAGS